MGYQEIKEEGKRCDWDLRGEERKETFGTYSDSSFKVVLVHPDSSASHSSLKRKNPRILLIIYTSSFTKVCSLLKLNLGLVSRNSAEFLDIWPGQTEAGTMSVIDVFDGLFPRNTVRIQHTGRDYVT